MWNCLKNMVVYINLKVAENFTMSELFERFMWFKLLEGLAPRTIEEY